jgi:hypothetical protein
VLTWRRGAGTEGMAMALKQWTGMPRPMLCEDCHIEEHGTSIPCFKHIHGGDNPWVCVCGKVTQRGAGAGEGCFRAGECPQAFHDVIPKTLGVIHHFSPEEHSHPHPSPPHPRVSPDLLTEVLIFPQKGSASGARWESQDIKRGQGRRRSGRQAVLTHTQ